MKLQKIWGDFVGGRAAWGLLLIRVVFGGALVLHGLQKVGAPTSWMNAFQPGVPAPLQFLAVLSELGGGLALLFGFLTPLAALGVFFTMAVATFVANAANPWVGAPGAPSKEAALGYLAFALLMLFSGPGRLSLDALWVPMLSRTPARNAPPEAARSAI